MNVFAPPLAIACALCAPASLVVPADPPVQEAAADAEVWSQEELEAVSERIRVQVEELRGRAFQRDVAVRLMDKEGLVQVLLDEFAEDYSDQKIAGIDVTARMLGLLPPDADYKQATLDFVRDQVGGFYLPGTDTFYLMESFTGGVAKVILSHELTHALDDQHFDLDASLQARLGNSDAALAFMAVVEGTASVLMTQWATQHVVDGEISMADMQEADRAQAQSLEDAPRYLWLPLLAPYIAGMQFLVEEDSVLAAGMKIARAARDGTPIPYDEAYADPPRSSEQVLHPEKYWDPAQRDEPRQIEFALEGDLPEGWEILHEDVLGELVLGILTVPYSERGGVTMSQEAVMGVAYTHDASAGWGGDRVALLGHEDQRFLRLVTVWDSPRDAGEFYGAMLVLLPDLEEQLKAVANAEVTSAKARRRTLRLEYGERDDEVVLTLAFGMRKSVVKDLDAALQHRERPAR